MASRLLHLRRHLLLRPSPDSIAYTTRRFRSSTQPENSDYTYRPLSRGVKLGTGGLITCYCAVLLYAMDTQLLYRERMKLEGGSSESEAAAAAQGLRSQPPVVEMVYAEEQSTVRLA